MSQSRLREYADADRDGLARLVCDVHAEFGYAYHPVLDADLEDPTANYRHLWVLEAAGEVVGSVALTEPEDGVTTLKRMYLRPEFRRKGWGRRLLDVAIKAAVERGCHRIELDTGEHQQRARRLYEAAGFVLIRQAGRTRHYVKDLRSADIDG